ncbi:hypothetical protein ACIQGW_18880 [Lysinibacillus xylanilyticus]|uniref:hypothetical protein n=1 Tax=Lysinibacillus xylanilyticus TaxID=582475 RepID=UPI003810F781
MNEILRDLLEFKYIIITPKEKTDMDTLFNRFDRNICNSINYLELISILPMSLSEIKGGWPDSANNFDVKDNYSIQYINEALINSDLLKNMNKYLFGALFIIDGVTDKVTEELLKSVRLPVVAGKNQEGCFEFDEGVIENLYKYWDTNLRNLIQDGNVKDFSLNQLEHKDYSGLKGIPTHSTHYMKPLLRGINRLRGIYLNESERNKIIPPPPLEETAFLDNEKEINTEIVKVLKNFIAEKYLLILIGFIKENSFSVEDEEIISEFGLSKEKLIEILDGKDEEKYLSVVENLLDSFDKIPLLTDMVLCIPSINYFLLRETNNLLGKNKISNKLLKNVYEVNTYRYLIHNRMFNHNKFEEEFKTFNGLVGERGMELALLSSISLMYALGKRIPYIRTNNIPSQRFYTLADASFDLSANMESRNTTSRFVQKINELCDFLLSELNPTVLNLVIKHGKHIKVISDLPLEWIKVNQLPLCVEKSFSRIPITPGNNIVSHSYVQNGNHIISKENIKILIMNTLDNDEYLYPLGQVLQKEINKDLSSINKISVYKEIKTKSEFIEAIEIEKPTILIYYGHGKFNVSEGQGELQIGTEKLKATEIESINHSPLITILGACETQVLNGTHLNTAALMLGNLSVSVIGSFFAVDGQKTLCFITTLIRNLINTLNGNSPSKYYENWSDIILHTYRVHYLLQPVETLKNYLKKRQLYLEDYIKEDMLALVFKTSSEMGIEVYIEILRNREKILLEIFKEYPILFDAFNQIIENHLMVEESLFYSSLGSPELIKINRED